MKTAWNLLKQTISEFNEDKVLRLAAALAYYAVFSIGPLLVLIVGVAGLVLGQEHVRQTVLHQVQGLVGEKSAEVVKSMMAARSESGSLLATIVGGVALLFGASGVFGQLQDSLNTIWEVKPKPGGGIMAFLRQRFLSMAMVLGLGFLLLVSMVLTTLVSAFSGYISSLTSLPEWIAHAFNILLTLAVVTVLFAAIFKVLPDVKIDWRDVWVGAFGTALLFTLGKFALGMYLLRGSTTSGFGLGAAFVIILMYIYYASLILFFGAEFTQVYARHRGTVIEPSSHAERVTDEKRAQEGMPRQKAAPSRDKKRPRSRRQPAAAPAHAPSFVRPKLAAVGGSTLIESSQTAETVHIRRAPLQQIKAWRGSFLMIAAGIGLTAGLLFKVRTLRRGFKAYMLARRFISWPSRLL